MASLPNPPATAHPWDDLVVGGSDGHPAIIKLIEENLINNGDFEEILSGWDGTNSRVDAGANAQKGNYVLSVDGGNYAHTYISRGTLSKVLFTGFLKIRNKVSSKYVNLRVYTTNATSRVTYPASYYVRLQFDSNDATQDGQWMPFYIMADMSSWVGTYIHIDFEIDSGLTGMYIDDLRLYEVDEVVSMECPNVLNLTWRRLTDASYEMLDGSMKDYLKGWRAVYTLGYEYCSRAQLIEDIGISESTFNFFVPQDDNLQGDYVRMINDFDSSYFHDRFLGHTQSIILESIFMRKFKNKEYGATYFVVTSA